ncbi:hypothetical protein LCGC14_2035550 [marine sediment metagenome]|uniref:LarC family nickel insertion protein n=1 Tax=marine sediment metagenome TaxID=412755 RepID=A0A0F9HQF0_9ZZZZ
MSREAKTLKPPRKLLWFDCTFGVSGDMCLGALVDAGAPFKELKELPQTLGLKGVSVTRRSIKRAGLHALKVNVKVDESAQKARRLRDVERIIRRASLPDNVEERSLKVFRRIFKAEARVHGGKPDEVHLHEMGAADTLIDIVGSVLLIELLGVDRVTSSPVAVGSGTIKCSHGVLPVPAPAVAELLKGVPVTTGIEGIELATPTGAAIVRELSYGFGPMPDMVLKAVGCGAGTREVMGQPNAMRVLIGESA